MILRISRTVGGMLLSRLEGLDRFLQWDLVTLNPWGTPVWAAVGARLLPDRG